MVAWRVYTSLPAPCIRYHTALANSKSYNLLPVRHHPNQSSVGGSLIRAIRCRGERRNTEWHTLLPLWIFGLLVRLFPGELIEATVDNRIVRETVYGAERRQWMCRSPKDLPKDSTNADSERWSESIARELMLYQSATIVAGEAAKVRSQALLYPIPLSALVVCVSCQT